MVRYWMSLFDIGSDFKRCPFVHRLTAYEYLLLPASFSSVSKFSLKVNNKLTVSQNVPDFWKSYAVLPDLLEKEMGTIYNAEKYVFGFIKDLGIGHKQFADIRGKFYNSLMEVLNEKGLRHPHYSVEEFEQCLELYQSQT